ncbi:MAG: tetratricopeptide repeat protein [Candidatus Aminicenantales bacterium]
MYEFKRPLIFQNYDRSSLQRHFLRAIHFERERNLAEAFQEYQALLEEAPDFLPALTRLAELYLRRGEIEKALELARKAVSLDMYDGAANYVYALAARLKGFNTEAKEALTWAARDIAFCGAALNQLSEIFLSEGQFRLAIEFAQRSLLRDQENIPSLQLLALAFRKRGETKKAQQILSQLENLDPLNPFLQLEKYWSRPSPDNWQKFRSSIHNEFPEETILELALYYRRLNQLQETLHLLNKIDHYPQANYWLGYLIGQKDKTQSQNYLTKARSLSPFLVFPFRQETIPVLKWAIAKEPSDWKARYYLALLLWSKGRKEEAEELLISCGRMPDYPPFYIVRGTFLKEKDRLAAQKDFQRSVELGNKEWRNWHHLIRYYLETNRKNEALIEADKAFSLFPNDMLLRADLVEAMMANHQYDRAAQLLDKTTFLPSEGATKIHQLFVDCHLQLGLKNFKQGSVPQAIKHFQKAKTYPEHLGTGQPFDPDCRLQDLLLGICYQRLGEYELAALHFQKVRDYTLHHWQENRPYHSLAAIFLMRKEKMNKAGELLKKFPLPKNLEHYYRLIIKELKDG